MKRLFILFIVMTLCDGINAQHQQRGNRQHPCPPTIQEIISDLTPMQQRRIDEIMAQSAKEIHKLEISLNRVRQQIRILIDKTDNQSQTLFPLFDKEANLEAQIAKKKYTTRQQIDAVLTEKQRQQLHANLLSRQGGSYPPKPPVTQSNPPKGQRR